MLKNQTGHYNMIQTTHVGSLPRPTGLIAKQLRKEPITQADLRSALQEIVMRQLKLGLSVINNGELPRDDYISSTVNRISGYNSTGTAPIPQDMEELPEYSRRFSGRNGLITLNPKAPIELPACSGDLGYRGEQSLRQELEMMIEVFDQLQPPHNSSSKLFFTAPSPGTVALFLENKYYPNYETYLAELGDVLQKEYDIIAGYDLYLQIDCPDLAMGRHTRYKDLDEKQFLSLIATNIEVLNSALHNVPTDRCRAHICWGNYAGTHNCDIELAAILPYIMNLKARYLSIESCNHRHAHEWEIFRQVKMPEDKILMPGVIDTTSNTVEHPKLVAQRLEKYVHLLGIDRVIGSTDCGFASTASATSVSGEIAWLKLDSLVRGAELANEKLSK